jgi:hypothetical protein
VATGSCTGPCLKTTIRRALKEQRMYRKLNSTYIVATIEILANRIRERFPDSNLNRVCRELLGIAAECEARVQRLRRPHWPLRVGISAVVLAFAAAGVAAVFRLQVSMHVEHIAELLQGLDAAVNEVILLSLALFFLFTLESRLKRREALLALHELRSIAHVIDMHQLTKDPETHLSVVMATPSSPQRTMTPFELSRYLDYCSELLSLISKLAAFHAQYVRDPVILSAVNDVEELTAGLSHKIWQKIMIIGAELTPAAQTPSPEMLAGPVPPSPDANSSGAHALGSAER